MTTMELLEQHGIGFNCLSDAYDLGYENGRVEAIDEFMSSLLEGYNLIEWNGKEYIVQIRERK